jgi:hypothetical protein
MNQSSPESNGESTPDAASLDDASSALDSVLEATLTHGHRTIKPEEWDRLRRVVLAAQQSNAPIDQWCPALVRELLEMRLPQPVRETKSLDHMSRMIASTLCSDPASKQRLIELQSQLLGDQP